MSFEQICYDRKVSHNCGSQPLPRTPQSPHKVAGWSRATAGPALTFARAHAGPLCVCRRQSRQPLSLRHGQSCAHSAPGLSCPIPVPGMVPHQQTKPWAGGGWQCFFSGPRTLQPSTGSWCLCARQVARPASPAHAAATQLPTAPSPTQLPTAPAVSLSPAVLRPAKVQGPGWAAGESLALIAAPHK